MSETALLPFVCDLMAKNYEAVGFLPRPRIAQYVQNDQVLTSSEGGDLCGYLIHGIGWPVLRVYQAVIDFDARRLDHGTLLVGRLVERAHRRGCSAISLWCADDLDANVFWRSVGFEECGRRDGGIRRGRSHVRWVMRSPDLFELRA